MLLKDKVEKSNREVRATMVYWESDRFIVGSQYSGLIKLEGIIA